MLDIKAIRERANAATKGPWLADLDVFSVNEPIQACVSNVGTSMLLTLDAGSSWSEARESQGLKDAEFIAASISDIPALCDEVERLRETIFRIYKQCGEFPEGLSEYRLRLLLDAIAVECNAITK
jgi:hypothetical protein